jgi:hypothetical protein
MFNRLPKWTARLRLALKPSRAVERALAWVRNGTSLLNCTTSFLGDCDREEGVLTISKSRWTIGDVPYVIRQATTRWWPCRKMARPRYTRSHVAQIIIVASSSLREGCWHGVWSGKRTCGEKGGMAVLLSFRVGTSRTVRVGACTVRL